MVCAVDPRELSGDSVVYALLMEGNTYPDMRKYIEVTTRMVNIPAVL